MLALEKRLGLIVENIKTAPWRPRRNVSSRKTKVGIRGEKGIGQDIRFVVLRINGVHRKNDRVIGWDRRSDNFINPHEGPGNAAVESMNETGCVGDIGAAEQGVLLHGTADFSTTRKFREIIDATTQFVLRARATGNHHSQARQEN